MVVRFNFESGKSCRYSTYTYSKQLGEFLRVGEGGGGHGPPRPPLNPPLALMYGILATHSCKLQTTQSNERIIQKNLSMYTKIQGLF